MNNRFLPFHNKVIHLLIRVQKFQVVKTGHEQRLKMNRSIRREAGTNWSIEQQQLTRTGWYLSKNSAGAEDRRDLTANEICTLWLK